MRVAFDEQIFLLQRRGGISRYFLELIDGLDNFTGMDPIPPSGPVASSAAAARWQVPLVEGRLARKLLVAGRRRRPTPASGADLVHRTFYDPAWLRADTQMPLVITVYDMIPELFPGDVPAGAHLAKREYVGRADLIVTISEQTRADLISCYGAVTAPVVVTPLGVDATFFDASASIGADLPPRYLIYVGNRDGYKDFSLLLQVLPDLPSDLRLVAVGGGGWTARESAMIRSRRLDDKVLRRDLSDKELAAAYAAADALVITSRYEGFGLPLVEAMAAGTPTVVARAGALPEVGGKAAHYFTPGDPDSLGQALEPLLTDPAVRQDSIDSGRQHAREFTWERTARLTADAYRALVAGELAAG